MYTLSFVESDVEYVSGIPDTVEINASSNISTIYYTLDGTLPTPLSSVYDGVGVSMPRDVGIVTLSAIGYFNDGYGGYIPGPVLSKTYDIEYVETPRRRSPFQGVVYNYPGGLDIPFWYDYNGNVTTYIDVDPAELDWVVSNRDRLGNYYDDPLLGTTIARGEDTPTRLDDNFQTSSDYSTDMFNPEALYIVVDGRASQPQPVVKVINSPFMSLRESSKYYRGVDYKSIRGGNPISGSLGRYFVNRNTNTIVFYYYDTYDCRWIKSIQDLPPKNDVSDPPIFRRPTVFKWLQYGRQIGII